MGSCLSKSDTQNTTQLDKLKGEDATGVQRDSGGVIRYTTPPVSAPGGAGTEAAPNIVSPRDIQIAIKSGKKVVRGLYDYVAAEDSGDIPDLNFKKGDVMEVLQEDGEWWLARNMSNNLEGYIPSTFVALEDSLDRHDWFHGKIQRKDAERLLLNPNWTRGAFLIRESESVSGAYSLSVLDVPESTQARAVKHYRIRDLDNGGCYITSKRPCTGLDELVEHYSSDSEGLCCKLTFACPKAKPIIDMSRETRDQWEIDRNTLVKMELLGAGNFGEVWRGLWKKKTPVAIKTLKVGTMEVSKFLEEATIMKRLRHHRLVTLYAVCTLEEPIYIVTELLAGGCLLQYLRNDAGKTLTPVILIDIAAQVAEGMEYIEKESLIHRDLAARNVLVGENNNVKIGDFGLARVINEDEYNAQIGAKFPIKWTAPEAIMYSRFTIKSDVWAYGILLVEIITCGQMPYPGMNNSELITQLQRGYRHPRPRQCSDDLYDIMSLCWKEEPMERPTFAHLFNTMNDFNVSMERGYADTS